MEKSLANVMAAIEQGIITSTTEKRLTELETLKTDLEVKIAKEEIQTQILTREQVGFWLKNMEKLDLAIADNRQRIINTFINSIYVHDDKFVVNFNGREESEVIPRDLEGGISSLSILGEPPKMTLQMALLSHCHKDTNRNDRRNARKRRESVNALSFQTV